MKAVKNKVEMKNLAKSGMSMRKIIQREVLNHLIATVDPGRHPSKPTKCRPNVYMMVGLQGSGKTTTCAKLGGYHKRIGWKTAVVAATLSGPVHVSHLCRCTASRHFVLCGF
jgi:signal recognition particle subunit SRP54